jgi:molecular chaperone GrpE
VAKKLIGQMLNFNPLNFIRKMKDHTHKEVTEEDTNQPNNETQKERATEEHAEPAADATQDPISETERLHLEVADLKDKILRIYSEFDNYKKRTAKERIDQSKTAGLEIILNMLPILDDFDRAKKSLGETQDLDAVKEGVGLIHNKIRASLESKGLQEMKTLNTPFDTDLHEAITNIPAPSDDLKGKVLDELEKGYFLNGKVIRFAKVVVGQ